MAADSFRRYNGIGRKVFPVKARAGGARMTAMKEKDIEDALLELGVKRGVLFFEELYDFFPVDYFPLEEMNRFLMLLEDLGVQVIEGDREGRQKVRHKHRAA
jgi:hypothetical protein